MSRGELARLVSAVFFMSQLYVVGIHRPGRYVGGFTVPSASGAQVLSTTTASMLSPLWFPLSSVYRSWQIEGALVNPSVGISGRHTVDPCYHILAAGGVVVAHP